MIAECGQIRETLPTGATALLVRAGLQEPRDIQVLGGGKNNRVLKILPQNDEPIVLKAYFRHPDDARDRLKHEWSFIRYAWSHNIRTVPEPLLQDSDHGLALYRFVAGAFFQRKEIKECDVAAASNFVSDLNQFRDTMDAAALPVGSEACFTIRQHIEIVEQRMLQLSAVPSIPGNEPMLNWLRQELFPAWVRTRVRAESLVAQGGMDLDDVLARSECLISPSDFGFHNALRRVQGDICFLDFEYAGWDDPAKLCGDFFNQVEIPVPLNYLPTVATALGTIVPSPERLRRRIAVLLPVYAVKWCCICLGPYLRAGLTRRQFSGQATDNWREQALTRAIRQFAKVQAAFDLASRI